MATLPNSFLDKGYLRVVEYNGDAHGLVFVVGTGFSSNLRRFYCEGLLSIAGRLEGDYSAVRYGDEAGVVCLKIEGLGLEVVASSLVEGSKKFLIAPPSLVAPAWVSERSFDRERLATTGDLRIVGYTSHGALLEISVEDPDTERRVSFFNTQYFSATNLNPVEGAVLSWQSFRTDSNQERVRLHARGADGETMIEAESVSWRVVRRQSGSEST